MSTISPSTPETALAPTPERRRRRGRRLAALVALVVVAGVIVVVVTDPFAGGAAPSGTSDNQYATSLQRITRQPLSSQTQISGTLGYAGDSTIRIPTGEPPAAVTQAAQTVETDRGMLDTARTSM
ncbi:MAG: hypothetical protein ACRDLP_15015, partial [Solirubrobacteraceae bacterium]